MKPLSKRAAVKQALDMEASARLLALAWPNYAKPKPMTHDEIKKLAKSNEGGYVRAYFMNSYTGTVTTGFTSISTHAREWRWAIPKNWQETRDRGSVSRDCGECYRTPIEAAQAMRWEATEKAAADLRLMDKRIERILAGKGHDGE